MHSTPVKSYISNSSPHSTVSNSSRHSSPNHSINSKLINNNHLLSSPHHHQQQHQHQQFLSPNSQQQQILPPHAFALQQKQRSFLTFGFGAGSGGSVKFLWNSEIYTFLLSFFQNFRSVTPGKPCQRKCDTYIAWRYKRYPRNS